MSFLESLRNKLRPSTVGRDGQQREKLARAWSLDEPLQGAGVVSDEPATEGASAYDRRLWAKKLRYLITEKLPVPEDEWRDFLADASALGFDPAWVERQKRGAFEALIHKVVADGVITNAEHQRIEQARVLLELDEPSAEAVVHRVASEAAQILGHEVQGS